MNVSTEFQPGTKDQFHQNERWYQRRARAGAVITRKPSAGPFRPGRWTFEPAVAGTMEL
jgi:hypothetical protein